MSYNILLYIKNIFVSCQSSNFVVNFQLTCLRKSFVQELLTKKTKAATLDTRTASVKTKILCYDYSLLKITYCTKYRIVPINY